MNQELFEEILTGLAMYQKQLVDLLSEGVLDHNLHSKAARLGTLRQEQQLWWKQMERKLDYEETT